MDRIDWIDKILSLLRWALARRSLLVRIDVTAWGLAVASLGAWLGQSAFGGEPCFRIREDCTGLGYVNVCGSKEQLPILEQNGQGLGMIDYDGDGLVDLYVANGSTESAWKKGKNPGNRLYRNLGEWKFEDVTDGAGVRGNGWSNGVAVADYDADGDFDLYVLRWGPNVLYRNNGDGTFADVTESAVVGPAALLPQSGRRWSSSAAFADFNGDGRLDLYVSNYVDFDFGNFPRAEKDGRPCLYRGVETGCGPWCYDGQQDALYVQGKDGRFEDRSAKCGLDATDGFRGFGVVAADLDVDGDVDVYIGCDVMPNLYLENVGGGRFLSAGGRRGGMYNGSGSYESGMGVAAADILGNGQLDLLVTNFAGETNTLYANESGMLSDRTTSAGLDAFPADMGWGVAAADFNNDGRTDVFVANGQIYPQVAELKDPHDPYAQPPRLLLQAPDGKFRAVASGEAFGREPAYCFRGLAAGDLDNDGDLDLAAVQHNGRLVVFENRTAQRGAMIELIDAKGGRSPMGAKVSSGSITRFCLPNQGYQSSQDHRVHWAVDGEQPVPLEVTWPDGSQQKVKLPLDKPGVTIRQGVTP
jgi:hypothetical protein